MKSLLRVARSLSFQRAVGMRSALSTKFHMRSESCIYRGVHTSSVLLAGHSHWHNIQHKKAKVDAERAKRFTKIISEIKSAVKVGGSTNPGENPRLATVLEKARAANLPKDKITAALSSNADAGEELVIELFGPFGTAFLIEHVTDSRNRAVMEMKILLKAHGFTMQNPGATKNHLKLRGAIKVLLDQKSEEELLETATMAGAEDVDSSECEPDANPRWATVWTDASSVVAVRDGLVQAGFTVQSFDRSYFPILESEIDDMEQWEKISNFASALEDLPDATNVYHNAVPSSDLIEQLEKEGN